MSKITDSIFDKNTAYAGHSPALDLKYGGQDGYMSRIGRVGDDGKYYSEWISNQAYVKNNIIAVVMKYPKFFDYMPDAEKLIAAYKALIELHPLTIDGLTSGLTVETDEHPVGAAGEMQEEITKVTRARSTVSFTYKEKAGKSIQKFVDMIIRYGYMDPDVLKPLVIQYMDDFKDQIKLYTPEFYTGTVLFIEPDITKTTVVDAWLTTNMFFKGNGDRTGKRDIRSAGELLDLTLETSGITLNNESILGLADDVLGNLSILNLTPDTTLIGDVKDNSEIETELTTAGVEGFGTTAGRPTK